MLKMNEMKSYTYDEAHCGYGDAGEMKYNLLANGYDIATSELLQTRQDQVFSNAGVRARGFSWADDLSNLHSTYFTGMNTSSVVAAGSWSSPSKDFSTVMGNDGHAVSGFDFIDAIPADGVFLDGVRNGYSLIEDRNFGSIDNKVDNAAKTYRPDQSDNAAVEACAEPILNIQAGYQRQNNSGTNRAGFTSEGFGITHSSIFAHEGRQGGRDV